MRNPETEKGATAQVVVSLLPPSVIDANASHYDKFYRATARKIVTA